MFFISSAQAQTAAGSGDPDITGSLIMFGGLFIFMYLFIIRPQRKRQKEHTDLITGLGKGDEVTMTSGILGKIVKLEGEYVVVEVNDKLELKFQKSAVHAVLPKGTIKAI